MEGNGGLMRIGIVFVLLVSCGSDDGGGVADASPVCSRAADCDDEVFCNGDERCEPESAAADSQGCVPGDPPCTQNRCDEEAAECRADPGCIDGDGDGRLAAECGGDDCDDTDRNRFPGNMEVCDTNDHDEDCDPETIGVRDLDMDGHIDASCCNIGPEGMNCGTDCDDMRAVVHPLATEACDSFDNDCDSTIDEGVLETFYIDSDGDGFGSTEMTAQGCTAPEGYVDTATDCDDAAGATNPAADEVCDAPMDGNPVDENCSGSANEGCRCNNGMIQSQCANAFGICAMGMQECINGEWGICSITPQPEICDGLDNNCNRQVDEGVMVTFYRDADGDGHGTRDETMMACDGAREGWVRFPFGDCDDSDAAINPGVAEQCDPMMVDEDCDGTANEMCSCTEGSERPCPDMGICAIGTQTCLSTGQWGPCSVQPLPESCDGLDNNCNGVVDEGLQVTFYRDDDGDGHGDPQTTMQACPGTISGWSNTAHDCDDARADVHPGHLEICDGIDNDCSEMSSFQPNEDDDGDGHADRDSTCIETAQSLPKDDCDDSDDVRRPGAPPQQRPRCGAFFTPCGDTTDGFGCRQLLACDVGVGVWDYNCDGEQTAATECGGPICAVTCVWAGSPGFMFCRGASSTRAALGPDCGHPTTLETCDGTTCTWTATGTTTVWCH